jgi:hypothetical protein
MDCEKFEATMMDELYGEADDVTSAAVKRHVASCSRCATLFTSLRGTRRAAALPLVEVPVGLERRILEAALAQAGGGAAPVKNHLARAVSAAGGWAMRPQSAMAAVFLVMLGASVLLLRGRSSRAPASSEMIVTEKGTPAPAPSPAPLPKKDDGLALAAPPAAARSVARSTAADGRPVTEADLPTPSARALPQMMRPRAFAKEAEVAEPSEAPAANGALATARALRDSQGCRAAVSHFDEVAQRSAGSTTSWQALFDSATCYRALGDVPNARARLTTLLGVAQFRDRARAELDLMGGPAGALAASPAAGMAASQVGAAAPPAAAAAPASPPPSSAGSGP